ncbi:MAG: peptidylprolyl isomerase [Prevotellaceae bacterium]|jgi:peptidyl-prolyl cis-trans isomerase D|nr:peptidylprolyl isomerase [Prevotellaceae bacterium]
MAVLDTLRQKAGPVLVGVIGIALLSFVLGDMFSTRGGGGWFGGNNVGAIAGNKISYEAYMHKVDYYTRIYRIMYGQNANSEMLTDEIREQAWAAFVREYAVDTEYEDFGLAVSGDELFDLVQGENPSPLIVRNFSNPQTGEFNRANVLGYLQSLEDGRDDNQDEKVRWLFLEKEIINQRLQSKLVNLVAKSLYVTTLDAGEALANTANAVNISYAVKRFDSFADSTLKVSNSDIKAYYNAHKNLYKQTASCDIEYIALPIEASAADDAAAKQWIDDLEQDFKSAKDPRQFVTLNSDVPFNDAYMKKGEQPAALDKFAFDPKTTKADILPPFMEDGSYKMARLVDSRMLPDSVKASHILLDSRQGLEAARKTADSIRTALKKGAKFADLAAKYSVDQAANQDGGDLGWFPHQGMVKPLGDSCFFAKKGSVVVVETQYGVHVVQVTDKGKEEKKVQLAVVERGVLASRATREGLFAIANEVASRSKDVATFNAVIAEKGLTRRNATRITINDRNVQDLQSARDLVRWASNEGAIGKVSQVFELDNNFVVAAIAQVRKDGYAPVVQVAQEIGAELLREKKGAKIIAELGSAMSAEAAAQSFGTGVQTASNITLSSFYLPGIGIEPKLAAAASASKQGVLAQPVIGASGVYVYDVISVKEDGLSDAAVAAEKARQQAATVQRAAYEVFDVLRTVADIKDMRGKMVF